MTSPSPGGAYVRPPRSLCLILSDPGSVVPRRFDTGPEQDEAEPLVWWQARALLAYGVTYNLSRPIP